MRCIHEQETWFGEIHCDNHYDSTLSHTGDPDGSVCLTLTVLARVYPSTQLVDRTPDCDPGRSQKNATVTTVYQADTPSPALIEAFKAEFRDSVHQTWNNKLQLVDILSRPRFDATTYGRCPPVRCQVDLQFLHDHDTRTPNLRIELLYNPTAAPGTDRALRGFRSYCARGGAADVADIDMCIGWYGPGSLYVTIPVRCSDQSGAGDPHTT